MTPEIRNLLKEARTIIRAHARWAAKDWDERATKALANSPQRTEQNFCSRCGKRTNDIHTCTPPQEKNT